VDHEPGRIAPIATAPIVVRIGASVMPASTSPGAGMDRSPPHVVVTSAEA
jgi:hypothetical protein